MNKQLSRKGGILLDLFLILVITGAGIVGWVMWRKGSVSRLWKDVAAVVPPVPVSLKPEPAGEPDVDISDRSAWLQGYVRELLAKKGVGEKHVLRTFNAERQENGIQWLEDTLELRKPAGFQVGGFLAAMAEPLAAHNLILMDDRVEGARHVLELGDKKRVYQRIVFEGSR